MEETSVDQRSHAEGSVVAILEVVEPDEIAKGVNVHLSVEEDLLHSDH